MSQRAINNNQISQFIVGITRNVNRLYSTNVSVMQHKYQLSVLVILLKLLYSLANINVEDYAFLEQQKMKHDIRIASIQITYVKDNYNDMITVIADRQQEVNEEIYQTNTKLTLMQAVNLNYRQCVRKHKTGLYTKDQAQEKFNACIKLAEVRSEKLMKDVETPISFAKQTFDVKLPLAVEDCKLESKNDTIQEKCVVDKFESQSTTFDENLDNVQDGLEINLAISALVARKAMECSFETERDILIKIGGTLQLIDMCIEDVQLRG